MRRNGRTFSQGVDLRGPVALSVTQREGGAKPPRRCLFKETWKDADFFYLKVSKWLGHFDIL